MHIKLSHFFKFYSHFATILSIVILFIILPSINNRDLVQSTLISKTLFFISCLLIIIPHLIIQTIFKIKISDFAISKIDISLVILVLYLLINRYVLQENYSFSIRFIDLLGLTCFYIVLRNISFKFYFWLFLAVILSGIIQAIYGNLQLLDYYPSNHSGFKITGSFFNPGPYAGFLAAIWPIALGFYLFKEYITKQVNVKENKLSSIVNIGVKYIFEYIPLIGVITIAIILPSTQSRAAWLAVIISSALLLELKYHVLKKVLYKLNILKKTVLISGAVLVFGISLFGIYHFKKGSSDGRLFIWKISTEIIKENPVFGVGFDRFKAHYMNAQAKYFAKYGETEEALVADNNYYAFNEFVQFIVENGLVGILICIISLGILFKTVIQKGNILLSSIVKIGLVTVGVFSLFSYPMQILPIKVIMTLLLALIALLDGKKLIIFKKKRRHFHVLIFKYFIGILSITFIIVGAIFISSVNSSFKTWNNALMSYQYGDYEGAIKDYEKSYPILKNNGDFLMNYGKALSIYKQDKKAIKILKKAQTHINTTIIATALGDSYKNSKNYPKAKLAYKQAADMIPTRFYPLYLLAKLYEESNEKDKAVEIAKTILKKDIKIPSTAIKEIQQEMKKILSQNDK